MGIYPQLKKQLGASEKRFVIFLFNKFVNWRFQIFQIILRDGLAGQILQNHKHSGAWGSENQEIIINGVI